ncbi:fructosamine kinase family protein [Stakelama sp. CBK3Z-3]|uniref:Fructosamine kinase family protein n=1 Tax=Stakelama flava TaxID=2860338 RepID=A0ABS6XMU5_9SPHN|nr:fructosamine kinase family protein [Stakelama flava]MBW4331511.1 fructosamine kinase family protein [Stakelama flava]
MTDPSQAAALLGSDIVASRPMSGGDLSEVVALDLADGRRVVSKTGVSARSEAAMLRAIAATGAPAPEVLAASDELLLIERVDAGGSLSNAWDDLAEVLGRLHGARGDSYGWTCDHAFGAVSVENTQCDDWVTFWADRRLRCHAPHVNAALARRIEALADRLNDHLPAHPAPALLHGDLWGGNVLVSGDHVRALIDPACYYGDREVDAAMLTLFDAPPARLFDALAFEPGWRERQPVYRLWPLLVHLRLFGNSYRGAVEHCLDDLGV